MIKETFEMKILISESEVIQAELTGSRCRRIVSGGNERRQVLRKGGKSPDRVRSCLLYWPSPTHHPKLELFQPLNLRHL